MCLVDSQEEYWGREFKAEVLPKDQSFQEVLLKLIDDRVLPILQLENNLEEMQFLESLPPNSIIGWCASDETYDWRFSYRIAKLRCFALVLRPYKLYQPSLKNSLLAFLYSAMNLRESNSLIEIFRMGAWQLRGLAVAFRQAAIISLFKLHSRKFINFPIGYTNVFAKSLARFAKVNSQASLFNLSETNPPLLQRYSSSFTGQSGQIVREVAIRALEKQSLSRVLRRNGYGASNVLDSEVTRKGDEYLRNLLDSDFVLCPPGNISGETFRLFETVVIQRLPLYMSHVTSDPNFTSLFYCGSINHKTKSWSKLINSASEVDSDSYREFVRLNTLQGLDQIRKSKDILLELNSKSKSKFLE